MSNLWIVKYKVHNEGSYEDFWKESDFVGVFDSKNKALQAVREHMETCERIYAMSIFEDYEFCNCKIKFIDEDNAIISWTEKGSSYYYTQHWTYFVIKTTINSYYDFEGYLV